MPALYQIVNPGKSLSGFSFAAPASGGK